MPTAINAAIAIITYYCVWYIAITCHARLPGINQCTISHNKSAAAASQKQK